MCEQLKPIAVMRTSIAQVCTLQMLARQVDGHDLMSHYPTIGALTITVR